MIRNTLHHFYIAGIFLVVMSALNADSTQISNAEIRYSFKKNVPEYVISDNKSLYDSLEKLAAKNPKHSPETGLGNLYEDWAIVRVYPKVDVTESSYTVVIGNVETLNEGDDNKMAYKLGLIFLSKTTGHGDQLKTIRFGFYDDKKIIQNLIDAVCDKAKCERPKPLSDKAQVAPGTRSGFSVADNDMYDFFEDDLKKSNFNLETPKESPEVEIKIYLPVPPHRIKTYYTLYLYDSPGIVRVIKHQKSENGKSITSELGTMQNKIVWRRFCEKFGTIEK